MTTGYTHQKLGWLLESNYGTDPFSASGDTWYKFGKYNQLWGDFPTEERSLSQLFTGASPRAQDTYFSQYSATAGISVSAVNALPLFWALGKVENSGTSDPFTRTITGRDVGEDLPSITPRTEDTDDDTDNDKIYEHYTGEYVKNLSTSIDFTRPDSYLMYLLQLAGQRIVSPAFSGVMDNDPVFPGSVSDHYQRDTNFVCYWDVNLGGDGKYTSGGNDVDISDELLNWTNVVDNALSPDKPQDQDYPDNYFHGIQSLICNFDLIRVGDNVHKVYDDFVTMQDNSTQRNMHLKIYQDDTHYLQFDLKNFTLGQAKRGNTAGSDQIPAFSFNGMYEDLTVTEVSAIDDRDNDNFYGDRSS